MSIRTFAGVFFQNHRDSMVPVTRSKWESTGGLKWDIVHILGWQ